jgi:hypothetical protein
MSEERKPSFMQELDQWSQANVIDALYNSDPIEGDWDEDVAKVKRAIREKVLESYRNGQQAGPRVGKGGRHGS